MKKKTARPKPKQPAKIKRFIIEIETGHYPPPPLTGPRELNRASWPLRQMAVGESFFVPLECRTRRQVTRLAMEAKMTMKKQGLPRTFAVRFFRELKGTRVYRTK